jgi:hypothetical protein
MLLPITPSAAPVLMSPLRPVESAPNVPCFLSFSVVGCGCVLPDLVERQTDSACEQDRGAAVRSTPSTAALVVGPILGRLAPEQAMISVHNAVGQLDAATVLAVTQRCGPTPACRARAAGPPRPLRTVGHLGVGAV